MREPKSYTISILKRVLPFYCRGLTLDVGAGSGKYAGLIKKYATDYIGFDNLSSARQFGDKVPAHIGFIGNVMNIPLKSGAAETVICSQVIEHVPEPGELMAELARVCKSNGHIFLATGWMAPYHKEPLDYFRFSKDGFRHLFEKNGVEMIELIPNGGVCTFLVWYPMRLIELKSKWWRRKLGKIIRPLELLAEWVDEKIDTSDHSIGYFAVGRKTAKQP
ncbi:MAG: class I SAM-dependent methyltransferase [Nitrospirae bacterium]|nr:class I SAM-dependent methyltransferase [Nitrospirota bacterium]